MYGVGVADLVVALVASALVFASVHLKLNEADPHGDLLAGLAATGLTLPIAWARRAPLTAAAVVAAASVANWLVVGQYVRCGPSLPSAFWIAYVIGRRTRGRSTALGMALVLLDIDAQCLSDPKLGAGVFIGMGPISVAFWVAGRSIRARNETVREIATQNAAIAETRERTAALAVATDRERISAGLDGLLLQRITDMGAQASLARDHLADKDSTAAFASIAQEGRQALAEMRDVVSMLRDASLKPQPGLGRLAELIEPRGGALELTGDQRPLPGGIEASAYRIVDQLLQLLEPTQPVQVRVRYADDVLELRVTGQPKQPRTVDAEGPELAVVRQRVAVHEGSLAAESLDDELRWIARLPLPTGHA
jgi:signal transduction histidine kinase